MYEYLIITIEVARNAKIVHNNLTLCSVFTILPVITARQQNRYVYYVINHISYTFLINYYNIKNYP